MTGPLASPARKLVRMGLVSLRLPENWRVGGDEADGFWAASVDARVVLGTWREGFAHDGDVDAAIGGAVEQVRAFHNTLTLFRPLRVTRAKDQTLVFVAGDFSDSPDPGIEFRWYVFVPEGDAIAILRVRLSCRPSVASSPEVAALVEDVDAQVRTASLHLAGQGPDRGRRLETPPPGTFDEVVERTFYGRMAMAVPARWRCIRLDTGYYCRDADYYGSVFVVVGDGHPRDRGPAGGRGGAVRKLAASMADAACDGTDEILERTELALADGAAVRVRARSADWQEAEDPKDPPNEIIGWGVARSCDGVPVAASILLNIPASLATEPVYRELTRRIDESAVSCRLVGPDETLAYRGPARPRDFRFEELAPRTVHDFVHVLVPTAWELQQTEGGRYGFWADGVENGTLWVDVERLGVGVKTPDPSLRRPGPTEAAPHGDIAWLERDAVEDDGVVIRIHQGCYFITDPDILAYVGDMVIVFFNLVILKELADHPEMRELVATMRREVALAHFG